MNRPLARIIVCCGLALAREGEAQPERNAGERFEEASPAVTWSGTWSKNALPAHSAGGAMLTMEAGAQATFAFSGASASWIGYCDEWSGLADVFLDGALQATVDTYATPARAQATLYAIKGLREGRHTLTIQARGAHGRGSAGSWVWVDAFSAAQSPRTPPPASSDPRRLRTPAPADGPGSRASQKGNARLDPPTLTIHPLVGAARRPPGGWIRADGFPRHPPRRASSHRAQAPCAR